MHPVSYPAKHWHSNYRYVRVLLIAVLFALHEVTFAEHRLHIEGAKEPGAVCAVPFPVTHREIPDNVGRHDVPSDLLLRAWGYRILPVPTGSSD
jgi:hypothetical protein